ncbi:MAG TPA: HEAT repeat domain-containing protein [Anaerolineales bacterium]|nr:HEAT repeat domain-containing protein [Anaerolineales bacterium]HNO30260.1 HEAT repeat domain-containing protein [Anaerolineales bacterium]
MFSFAIDPFSFFVGFAAATVFWFLVTRARPLWNELREEWKERRETSQSRRSSTVEDNFRRVTLRRAQGMHLAAQIFALDEILQEPRLLAPPPRVEPGTPAKFEDVVTHTLPYLPAWPEIAAIYKPQTFTMPEAISGNANIVIIGQPGVGKTVALAHLASLAANRSDKLGKLNEVVPFLIHVADLNLPLRDLKNVLGPIIEASAEYASTFEYGKLSSFIQQTFKAETALLLLDGYDEITPNEQQTVSDYLKILLQNYPNLRVVTTGTPEYLDGLVALGFIPLSVCTWSDRETQAFIETWGRQWSHTVAMESWAQTTIQHVDPFLLNSWLDNENLNLSPLELTLKVWGAYAGDSLGSHTLEWIASHIRRIAPANTPLAALETLAMQVVVSAQPVFDPRKARAWVKSFEVAEDSTTPLDAESAETSGENDENIKEDTKPLKGKKKTERVSTPSTGLLGKMAASGLLVSYPNNRMRFSHPVFAGYLAGHALTNYNVEENILNQPDWSGKYLTMRYFAAHGDATKLVNALLEYSRLPMHRPLFAAARWLRDAPRNAPWRGKLFGALAGILQMEGVPISLRGQAMAAFAYSNDPAAATLFRQFSATLSTELVHLAVLGLGAVRDVKALKSLENNLQSSSLNVRRATCLALVAIGTEEALEAVAHTLLGGDEDVRRAAGEALANDPEEGHAMLKDGITMNDILVRRAVVYGLGRVPQDWAVELLRKIQIEDDQWIVKNAATEVLDAKTHMELLAPAKLKAPHESPWLIEFAARNGMGVSPGVPATDLLLTALLGDDHDARMASLPYLKFSPTEGVITQVYDAMYSREPELREAAYMTLWEIGAAGVKLPNPTKFGMD